MGFPHKNASGFKQSHHMFCFFFLLFTPTGVVFSLVHFRVFETLPLGELFEHLLSLLSVHFPMLSLPRPGACSVHLLSPPG